MRKVNKSHRKPVVRKSEVKRSHQIIEPMQSTDTHEIINNEDMEKPKKHRTWLVVIVILIFIVAVAALSFFVWKKYFDNSNKAVSPVKQVELTKPPEIQTGDDQDNRPGCGQFDNVRATVTDQQFTVNLANKPHEAIVLCQVSQKLCGFRVNKIPECFSLCSHENTCSGVLILG